MAWPEPGFVAVGTAVFTANSVVTPTTLAPQAPASRAIGNLLVLVTESRSNTASAATPSGWNTVAGFPIRSGTASGGTFYVFTRIADGTASDNASFDWSSLTTGTSGDSCGARILAFEYATQTLDGALATTQDQASTTSFTINACSPTQVNSLWIGLAMRVHDTAHTFTVTTLTERYDGHTTTGTGHGTEVSAKSLTASGSTGTGTVTPSNTTSMRTLTTALCFQAANLHGATPDPYGYPVAMAGPDPPSKGRL